MSRPNPQNLWICEYVTFRGKGKWRSQMELSLFTSRPWGRKIILYYPGGPDVVIMVLLSGRGRWRARTNEMVVWAKYCSARYGCHFGWPLEFGKGKETNSVLEPLEETQSLEHLNFNPVRPILNFRPSEL